MFNVNDEIRQIARIALASLEVAPVGEVSEKRHGLVMDGTVDLGGKSTYRIIKGEKAMKRLPLGTKFYIAPPAPVVPVVPEEMPAGLAGQIVSLLPCPFCGSPAEHYPDGDMEGHIIMCGNKNGDCNLQAFGFTTPEEAEKAWNTRAALLQGVEQPQNARQNIPDGNSPAIPDDWVMVPKEPTQAMINAWLSEVANWRGHVAGYKAALAAAPQQEVK
ncbi:TPA: Lar family restriction alleviation protein [Salmonella enterica subsp. enterica]